MKYKQVIYRVLKLIKIIQAHHSMFSSIGPSDTSDPLLKAFLIVGWKLLAQRAGSRQLSHTLRVVTRTTGGHSAAASTSIVLHNSRSIRTRGMYWYVTW